MTQRALYYIEVNFFDKPIENCNPNRYANESSSFLSPFTFTISECLIKIANRLCYSFSFLKIFPLLEGDTHSGIT